jgi:hypothetical protein
MQHLHSAMSIISLAEEWYLSSCVQPEDLHQVQFCWSWRFSSPVGKRQDATSIYKRAVIPEFKKQQRIELSGSFLFGFPFAARLQLLVPLQLLGPSYIYKKNHLMMIITYCTTQYWGGHTMPLGSRIYKIALQCRGYHVLVQCICWCPWGGRKCMPYVTIWDWEESAKKS